MKTTAASLRELCRRRRRERVVGGDDNGFDAATES